MANKKEESEKRKKKVLPGTAKLKPRKNAPPVSNTKVGHGRYNNGSYLSFYLHDEDENKYVNKRTGKIMPREQAEMRARIRSRIEENYEPYRRSEMTPKLTPKKKPKR